MKVSRAHVGVDTRQWNRSLVLIGASLALMEVGCVVRAKLAPVEEACKLRIVLPGTTFRDAYTFRLRLEGESEPLRLLRPGGVVIQALEDSAVVEANCGIRPGFQRTTSEWPFRDTYPMSAWDGVARVVEDGLIRIAPGRYRVIVRYLPRGRAGQCECVSEPFVLEEDMLTDVRDEHIVWAD